MRYVAVKIVCMFDLPTITKEDKRDYRTFRKRLLQDGFQMLQYSVYIRTCPDRSFANKFHRRIKSYAPRRGDVRLFNITEKQFEDMEHIICSDKERAKVMASES